MNHFKLQPDPAAANLSVNEYLERLPRLRCFSDCLGLLLLVQRTGQVVVPFEGTDGGWNCVVVAGAVGRSSLVRLSDAELECAVRLELDEAAVAAAIRAAEELRNGFGRVKLADLSPGERYFSVASPTGRIVYRTRSRQEAEQIVARNPDRLDLTEHIKS